MGNGSANGNTQLVRSVERALMAMEILGDRGWSGVTEVARELDVHKSTAFRLLATLEHREMVVQDPETAKYRLGPGIAQLGRTVDEEVDLRRHARDVMSQLAAQTEETVNLAILDGTDVICVDQIIGSPGVLSVDWLGSRIPINCTASGKAIVAFLPERRRRGLLGERFEAATPRTVVDRAVLERHLAKARVDGYATIVGELEVGLNAVAAPIFDGAGQPVAALTVSGPDARMPEPDLAEVGVLVRRAAEDVSRQLGYDAPVGDAPARS